MSAPSQPSTSVGTESQDYGDTYYRTYGDEPYDWASPQWRTFFTMVAERLQAATNPSSVLDVGCARGLLVQAFREQGLDAYGIDVSEYAIETAHPDVAARLSVGSAEGVEGSWDLITCIEVLEHMAPADAQRAIDSMCAASDRVLLSSTPSHFGDPTHINVREPAAWAASFAERGFFRRTDVDLAFLAPWAVLFERADPSRRDLVYRYESYTYPMRLEVLEKRAALRDARRNVHEPGDLENQLDAARAESDELRATCQELRATCQELRHNLLTSRDHAIGAEAEAAQWRVRYEKVGSELQIVYGSKSWRLGRGIVGSVARLRQRLR